MAGNRWFTLSGGTGKLGCCWKCKKPEAPPEPTPCENCLGEATPTEITATIEGIIAGLAGGCEGSCPDLNGTYLCSAFELGVPYPACTWKYINPSPLTTCDILELLIVLAPTFLQCSMLYRNQAGSDVGTDWGQSVSTPFDCLNMNIVLPSLAPANGVCDFRPSTATLVA